MIELIDTHCHIQEAAPLAGDVFMQEKWAAAGFHTPSKLISEATGEEVSTLICVGCTLKDSEMAVDLAQKEVSCFASIGIHPHEAKDHIHSPDTLQQFGQLLKKKRVVAVGETGLDYFYTHSPRPDQIKMLIFQLKLAQKHDLPLILHIRDAYEDFWPVFDQFKGLRGVVHSFSAHIGQLDQALSRGLYIGLNGIMTFTRDEKQLEAAKKVPLERLLLETDAPFLTPVPHRGKICQPKHVRVTAEFLATLRSESLEELARATTRNARQLFRLKE